MQQDSTPGWTRRAFGLAAAAFTALSIGLGGCASSGAGSSQASALPSWNDGPARQAIVQFVADVTQEGSPSYVPPAERIAVFDNDGTLWAEQPLYFQFLYWLDVAKAAAPQHPEWKSNPVYDAVVKGDAAAALANQKALFEILTSASAGISVEAYDKSARDWLAKTRHP